VPPHVPRLPRAVEADPRSEAVHTALRAVATPLWPGAEIEVPSVPPSEAIRGALSAAGAAGRVGRGLEAIAARLDAEAHGLRAAGMGDAARASRLLIVSDDGSERFYRQVGRVLREHGHRVLALRLRCDAATLGATVFGAGTTAKAACVSHKAAVAGVLLALVAPAHRRAALVGAPTGRPRRIPRARR
jgi:hypothetical protein